MKAFMVGEVTPGTVVGLAPFMAFVELEPGIRAQISVTKIPGNEDNRVVYGLLDIGDVRLFEVTGAVCNDGKTATVTLNLLGIAQLDQALE